MHSGWRSLLPLSHRLSPTRPLHIESAERVCITYALPGSSSHLSSRPFLVYSSFSVDELLLLSRILTIYSTLNTFVFSSVASGRLHDPDGPDRVFNVRVHPEGDQGTGRRRVCHIMGWRGTGEIYEDKLICSGWCGCPQSTCSFSRQITTTVTV